MNPLLNIVLITVVVWFSKKKPKPLLSGLAFGGAKAFIDYLILGSVSNAVFIGVLFGLIGTTCVYLLARVARKPNPIEDPRKTYKAGGSGEGVFYWEYVPLCAIALFLLAGEFLLSFIVIRIS